MVITNITPSPKVTWIQFPNIYFLRRSTNQNCTNLTITSFSVSLTTQFQLSYSDGSLRLSILLNITGNKSGLVPAQHVSGFSCHAFLIVSLCPHCCQGTSAKSSSRSQVTPTASASDQGSRTAGGGKRRGFFLHLFYFIHLSMAQVCLPWHASVLHKNK